MATRQERPVHDGHGLATTTGARSAVLASWPYHQRGDAHHVTVIAGERGRPGVCYSVGLQKFSSITWIVAPRRARAVGLPLTPKWRGDSQDSQTHERIPRWNGE